MTKECKCTWTLWNLRAEQKSQGRINLERLFLRQGSDLTGELDVLAQWMAEKTAGLLGQSWSAVVAQAGSNTSGRPSTHISDLLCSCWNQQEMLLSLAMSLQCLLPRKLNIVLPVKAKCLNKSCPLSLRRY